MNIGKYAYLPACILLAACGSTPSTNTPRDSDYIFNNSSKPASDSTNEINQGFITKWDELMLEDRTDYDSAKMLEIKEMRNLEICNDGTVITNGSACPNNEAFTSNHVIWSAKKFQDVITAEGYDYDTYSNFRETAPDSVNPSLWRNAILNSITGLYGVYDSDKDNDGDITTASLGSIYQVRGYDLSNITFVYGENGWIVFDPLISPQTAKAAEALVNQYVSESHSQTSVVIYSHSHTDHYGGINGLTLAADASIIAPKEFAEHAISENVIAGNAMSRRAVLMYGSLLDNSVQGSVNAGLGMTTSIGTPGLQLPTLDITTETEATDSGYSSTFVNGGDNYWSVDGVQMEFQMTPGTEAPAEMNTYLPEYKALWMAENTTNTMHNILTLRGAKVRDALIWAKFLTQTIQRFGDDAIVKFQSHHWPVWGNKRIKTYLGKQRDVYKYMHDQTVRLMNMGYNGEEISEMIQFPKDLEENWATRGYYGTLRHNTRAIYQFYMGWYNGNPSDLNNLPDAQASIRYVDMMGGAQNILNRAVDEYNAGHYRWVAELLKHVVFAYQAIDKYDTPPSATGVEQITYQFNATNPSAADTIFSNARLLLADAYEQLGYQAESGPWRSVYLQGAAELRRNPDAPTPPALNTASPEVLAAMEPEMVYDSWAVQLDAQKAVALNADYSVVFKIEDDKSICEVNRRPVSAGKEYDFAHQLNVHNAVLDAVDLSKEGSHPNLKTVSLPLCALQKIAIENGKKLNSETPDFDSILTQYATYENGATAEDVKKIMELITPPNFWFNVIDPNDQEAISYDFSK